MSDLQWNRAFALEQAGDDEEMLAELLELFRKTSLADYAKIDGAQQRGNAAELAAAAHSIKGAAASLGVEGVRQVAHELEKAGQVGNLDSTPMMISRLKKMLDLSDSLK